MIAFSECLHSAGRPRDAGEKMDVMPPAPAQDLPVTPSRRWLSMSPSEICALVAYRICLSDGMYRLAACSDGSRVHEAAVCYAAHTRMMYTCAGEV